MATLLLIIIYMGFISLGLPDSLFGTAWPAVYREFDIPISWANYVTFLTTCGTLISSLISPRLLNKFGTNVVAAGSTLLTAAAMLGFAVTNQFWFICLLCIPLGLGAGAVDSGLNNYVALHYKAMHMNFLHCFYGVGISISPYLMSMVISGDAGWRGGYKLVALIQGVIAAVLFLSIPMWKKVHPEENVPEEEQPKTLSFREIVKLPILPFIWLIFIGSCALELTAGSWGSTFLVEAKGMTIDAAAGTVLFYYLGIAAGRFLSGLLSVKLSPWKLILLGQGIAFAALVLLLCTGSVEAAATGLFLIGLGNSSVYPNLMHITPIIFGKDVSQSVMGTNMAAATIGVMVAPIVFGWLGQKFGLQLYPPYLVVMFVIMMAGTLSTLWKLKKRKRFDINE